MLPALLSGRYSYTVGAAGGVITNGRPNALPLNVSTIADNLRAAGWRCMAAGKYDIGMHTWAHTPTFRGFEKFVGFYDAAEDHFSHQAGGFLDLRNDTAPLRTANGSYSTNLYSASVVDFIHANAPGTAPADHGQPGPVVAAAAAEAATAVKPACSNISLRHDWSAGGVTAVQLRAPDAVGCCALCAANATCAAFAFQGTTCYLKDSATQGHPKPHVTSGILVPGHGPSPEPPRPSPIPAPPAPPPVPGGSAAPLFIYLAFQAVHSPLQAPAEYIARCPEVLQKDRQVLCGMMHAVDEGILNVTDALKATLRWNSTLLIFSTDNGGTGSSAGTNVPLRGQKATMWEGGVRGVGFVTGFGLSAAVRGTTSNALLHVSDWMPTIVQGIAGLPAVHSPPNAPPLDGVDAWGAIATGGPGSRKEVLLNLCPDFAVLGGAKVRYGWQQSALRFGEMKLIWGLPGDEDKAQCEPPRCKNGWQAPPALGNSSWPRPEPPETATFSPGVWLFNLTADEVSADIFSICACCFLF